MPDCIFLQCLYLCRYANPMWSLQFGGRFAESIVAGAAIHGKGLAGSDPVCRNAGYP